MRNCPLFPRDPLNILIYSPVVTTWDGICFNLQSSSSEWVVKGRAAQHHHTMTLLNPADSEAPRVTRMMKIPPTYSHPYPPTPIYCLHWIHTTPPEPCEHVLSPGTVYQKYQPDPEHEIQKYYREMHVHALPLSVNPG